MVLLEVKTGYDRQTLESTVRAMVHESQLTEVVVSKGTRYHLM